MCWIPRGGVDNMHRNPRIQIRTPFLLISIPKLRMESASAGGVADVAATMAATPTPPGYDGS